MGQAQTATHLPTSPLTESREGRPGEDLLLAWRPKESSFPASESASGPIPSWVHGSATIRCSPPRVFGAWKWQLLARASPGSILKALHLTAVPWGPCWWIDLAGGASFMHLSLGPHASLLHEPEGRGEGKITRALLNLTFCWTRWVTLESASWTRPPLGPSALPVNTGLEHVQPRLVGRSSLCASSGLLLFVCPRDLKRTVCGGSWSCFDPQTRV